MNSERDGRLNRLLKGAWMPAAEVAEEFLRPPKGLVNRLIRKDHISIQDLEAREEATATKKRTEKITQVLRAHWKSRKGVDDPEEIERRDSFDEALTLLQLLELGAESSYLREAVVIRAGRTRLLSLLWSKGARAFVKNYDYLGVRFLAARCDIDLGLPKVTPPRPDPQAQVQFATFLSQHQGWYGDSNLDWWLGLLDDYVNEEDEFKEPEDEAFHRFLRLAKLPCANPDVELRFNERAEGLNRFLFLLSNLFSFLPPEIAPLYGSLYLYWMAKFFGYELGEDGYTRDAELYYDWSRVASGPVLCATEARQEAVHEQVGIIRQGFQSTKSFVEKHLRVVSDATRKH
jgi:hypothetical protein